jgi:uncharacterized Zn finger protein
MKSDWEVFSNAMQHYADVLGDVGLATYRELAEKAWAKLPALGPGQDRQELSPGRFHITQIMEELAAQTGDVEKQVQVQAKDLSHAYSYLTIAELYRKAKNADKALEWAERGVKAFPEGTDTRLRQFLANEYHSRGRHDEVMQLFWDEFCDVGGLEQYKLLKIHALKAGGPRFWNPWREKALQFIRDSVARDKQKRARNRSMWFVADYTELVRIFLWEKNVDAAWKAAQEGDCHPELWLELAERRGPDHPEDALAVYRALVEPTVLRKNNDAYAEAIEMVRQIQQLLHRLGRKEEWEQYLASLQTMHRRLRNFMAMLESVK